MRTESSILRWIYSKVYENSDQLMTISVVFKHFTSVCGPNDLLLMLLHFLNNLNSKSLLTENTAWFDQFSQQIKLLLRVECVTWCYSSFEKIYIFCYSSEPVRLSAYFFFFFTLVMINPGNCWVEAFGWARNICMIIGLCASLHATTRALPRSWIRAKSFSLQKKTS